MRSFLSVYETASISRLDSGLPGTITFSAPSRESRRRPAGGLDPLWQGAHWATSRGRIFASKKSDLASAAAEARLRKIESNSSRGMEGFAVFYRAPAPT